jgi:threonine synthase
VNQLICNQCNAEYVDIEKRWQCDCGGYLDLRFQPHFSLDKIMPRQSTMWRYREALPLAWDTEIISLGEGFTPILEVPIANRPVFVKQEQLFPSGSYKDRGATLLISKIKELGIKRVVEDSSGNAGSSVAAYCAAAGIMCDIYVPASTSAGKLAQIEAYGAVLHKIPGTREDTANAVLEAAETHYYASHTWNPFFFHGTKTFAFEVCEQLGWYAPDTVILPAGNGTLLLGTYLGFKELQQAGIIGEMPKFIGVQAENCAPLYHAYKAHSQDVFEIETQKTMAEGIAIAAPVRGKQILEAVKNTNGEIIAVNETEINQSKLEMWHKGFFIEPTSAAVIAGVNKYLLNQEPANYKEVIISVFTGHGLKATT